jgi:hypothetical protein
VAAGQHPSPPLTPDPSPLARTRGEGRDSHARGEGGRRPGEGCSLDQGGFRIGSVEAHLSAPLTPDPSPLSRERGARGEKLARERLGSVESKRAPRIAPFEAQRQTLAPSARERGEGGRRPGEGQRR